MTPLEQIFAALEHARPYVKGAALEREISEALEVARGLVGEECPICASQRRAEQEAVPELDAESRAMARLLDKTAREAGR